MARLFPAATLALAVALGAAGCAGTIHTAAEAGRAEEVARFLDQGVPIGQVSENGHFPLELAALKRRPGTVKLLIERGAPLDQRRPDGKTALDLAITQAYNAEVIGLLRKAGARTGAEVSADKSATPLPPRALTAKERRYRDALAARTPAGFYLALCLAADEGWVDRIQEAVNAGADPNAKDPSNGNSIFVCAIDHDRPESIRALVAVGADPALAYEGTGYGASAAERARMMGRASALRALDEARSAPRRPPEERGDDTHGHMRASAEMPAEKKQPLSDVDSPSRKSAERPDDFALVIGIEEYQSLPKADYGVRDARTMRRHLESLGFPARNIVSLEGAGATKSKLQSYLEEWLPLNVKPGSTLFIYYSGHGAPDPKSGDAYLVPWDGDPKFLRSTAYPLKKLYADLAKTKAERVVVALDACFSGAGGRSVLAQGARPLVTKVDDGVVAPEHLTVLAAASGDEITSTLEDQGHGLFTYHFLKVLSADPKSSARVIFAALKPKVQDDARRQNREQTPTLAGAALDEPLLP